MVARAVLVAADEDGGQAHGFGAAQVGLRVVADHPRGLGAGHRPQRAIVGPRVRFLLPAFGGVEEPEEAIF